MGLWQAIRRLVGQTEPSPRPPVIVNADQAAGEDETVAAEVTVDDLRAALAQADPPLVLDIREPFEWRQVRMPGATHIPMNSIPAHLAELPRDRAIVVVCAHGSRSYSVAAWLTEQGLHAASLHGGITQWAIHGGPVEPGAPQ